MPIQNTPLQLSHTKHSRSPGGPNFPPSVPPLAFSLPNSSGVTVIRSPPGYGKSRTTREQVVAACQSGSLHRVLWAVQGTLDESSLGMEAYRAFQELDSNLKVTVVMGSNHIDNRREYRAQLDWGAQPEVKIISFAHLPLIYGQDARVPQLRSDILIIDELPLDHLISAVELSNEELSLWQPTGGLIVDRLLTIMEDINHGMCSPTRSHPTNVVKAPEWRKEQHYLTGTAFRQAIGPFTPTDWQQFAAALHTAETKELGSVSEWSDAFRQALVE